MNLDSDKFIAEGDMRAHRSKLALKAYNDGCMIYSSDSQSWFTPREFVDSKEVIVYRSYAGNTSVANMTLHYVKSAIQAEEERLASAVKRNQEFMEKVLNAFDLHPTGRKSSK